MFAKESQIFSFPFVDISQTLEEKGANLSVDLCMLLPKYLCPFKQDLLPNKVVKQPKMLMNWVAKGMMDNSSQI